jgi:hypothetical protein
MAGLLRSSIRQAQSQTRSLLRGWGFGWFAIGLFGLGSLVHLYRFGVDAVISEWHTWASYTLAPIGAFACLVFLFNLACAPFRLERVRADEAERRIARQNDRIHKLEMEGSASVESRIEGPVWLDDLPVASFKYNWRAVCLESVRITNRSATRPASLSVQVRLLLTEESGVPRSMVFVEDAYPTLWRSLSDMHNDLTWLHSPINLSAGQTVKGNIGVVFLPRDRVLKAWRMDRRGGPVRKCTLELVEHVSGSIVEVDLSSSFFRSA